MKGATPKASEGNSTFAFIRKLLMRSFNIVCFPIRKRMTQTEEIPCDITVASAAPCTHISKTKISIGSKMILVIAPITTVSILILLKPCADIKAFIPSVSWTKIVPAAYMII